MANLPKAASLLTAIRGTASHITNYNLLFGTTIAATGALTAADRKSLFDTAGDPAYVQATFLANLPKAASLLTALRSNASQLSNYNSLFGTAISAGALSVNDRKSLFDTTGAAGYAEAAFLASLPKVVSLLAGLRANNQLLADFNLIFAVALQSSGAVNASGRKALFDTVGDAAYVQATFLNNLHPATTLYFGIQGSPEYRVYFNALYGTQYFVTSSDASTAMFRLFKASVPDHFYTTSITERDSAIAAGYTLEGIAGYVSEVPGGGNVPFYRLLKNGHHIYTSNETEKTALIGQGWALEGIAGYIPPVTANVTAPLFRLYRASNGDRIYTTSTAERDSAIASGFTDEGVVGQFATFEYLVTSPNAADRKALFDVVGDASFNQNNFFAVLPLTGSLYAALQGNTTLRGYFNALYGTAVPASGAPPRANLAALFGVAGAAGYSQTTYLQVLNRAGSLYSALQTNATHRANFNLLFNTALAATGAPSAADRGILFDTAGPAAFNQASFLAVMAEAAPLYSGLRSNVTNMNYFNLLYGANIAATGALSAANRTILFNVAGGAGFNASTYLNILPKAGQLYVALQGNAAKRAIFNSRFSAAVPESGSPNGATLGVIFGLTGDPNYNFTAFWASLV